VFTVGLSLLLSSFWCCPPNISSVTQDQDEFCELPAFPGGGSPNQGRSRGCWTKVLSRHLRIGTTTLSLLAAAAEFRIIDLIAQHNPQTNAQFARSGYARFAEPFLHQFAAVAHGMALMQDVVSSTSLLSVSNIAMVCCRVCKSQPIIRLRPPSAQAECGEHKIQCRAVVRPNSLCRQRKFCDGRGIGPAPCGLGENGAHSNILLTISQSKYGLQRYGRFIARLISSA
jgi:hypothetical protein